MKRAVGAIAAVVLLVTPAACGGDGDDVSLGRSADAASTTTTDQPSTTAPTTTDTTEQPPTTTSTTVPSLRWERCGDRECATLAVPVDHDDPGSGLIDLHVARLPATGDRIGGLFVNFGGPGAGAAALLGSFPFPASVRARFDIVAMDPRGVGRSEPLDCGLPAAELYRTDPTIEDPGDAEALVGVSRRYADDCSAERGPLLPHVGTGDVIRDMDLVRAAMGDEQLSYLGYSYGTSIGQAYAERFPTRVRAMVLDGVVDPAASGIDFATEQAEGFEAALGEWAASCGGRSSCPFGADALGAVDRMLAMAEEQVPSSGGVRALGPGEAAVALAYPLYSKTLWAALDQAVAAVLDGDGREMVLLAEDYFGLVELAPYFAVSCLDSSWPRSTDEFLSAAERAATSAPRFGEAIVNDYIRCAVWPAPPEPLGGVDAAGAPPILVVSTTGDPATPHENGVRVADRLASGVLLTNEGEGHTITFQGSSCVDAVVVPYLVDLVVPAEGARC